MLDAVFDEVNADISSLDAPPAPPPPPMDCAITAWLLSPVVETWALFVIVAVPPSFPVPPPPPTDWAKIAED